MAATTVIAVASVVVAAAGTAYNIAASEEAKDKAEETARRTEEATRQQAEAQAQYEAEMATAQAEAARQQALLEQQELDRQAAENERKAQEEADNLLVQGERTKKAQIAAMAKAGMSVLEGTALDLTKETDELVGHDVKSILESGKETATSLRNAGSAKLKSAEAEGDLLIKQATGRKPLLMGAAAQQGQAAWDRANQIKSTANASMTQSVFNFASTAVSSYDKYNTQKNLLEEKKTEAGNLITQQRKSSTGPLSYGSYFGNSSLYLKDRVLGY